MRHSIKNRVLSGLMSFVIAVGFVCASAVPDLLKGQNVSADVLLAFDSASQVNYSTILGRATDYGIVSDTIVQPVGRHMESNFAVNVYSGNHNFDVDLAGSEPVPFIVGEVTDGSKMATGKNYNSDPNQMFVVYTTKEIIDGNLFTGNEGFFKGKISFVELSKEDINSNVNSMIDHFIDQSNLLLSKPSIDVSSIYNSGTQTLDLSNSYYKDSTIYIDVEAGSSLQQGIASGNFKILKDSSTVVVFNVLSDQNVTLNQYSVILNGSSNEILSTTDSEGNDTPHNKDVDNELARKIIWNVPNASSVNIDKTAGVFLLPNSNTVSEVTGSSAGWVASAGTTKIGAGEFHYIYHNRSTDINNSEYGSFHFAARKAFTTEFNGKQTQEIKNIYAGAGQYEFSFVETESDYSTIKKTFDNVYTDEFGKITFPSLSFKIADIDPITPEWHYYVIKEYAMHNAPSDISQSTGEIDIAVKVTNNNGVLSYEITEYRYLKAGRSIDDLYKDPTPVVMSGTEFSLGGFYNLYTGGYGKLTLSKELGIGTSADYLTKYPNKTYKVAVKIDDVYVQDTNGTLSANVKYFELSLTDSLTINNLIPGTYTIVEDESDVLGYNLTSQTCTVDSAQTSSVVLTGNSSKSAVLTNTYEKVDLTNKGTISITKSVTGLTDSSKEYEVAVQAVNGKYVGNINGTSESDSIVWFKIKKGETLTFSGLDTTKTYNIYEKKSSAVVSGYDLVVTGFSTENEYSETYKIDAPISFDSNNAVQVNLENKYTQQLGKLTIKKSFVKSDDSALVGSFGDVTFTITGPNSYSNTVKYSEFTDGKYEISNLPVGTYTISESGADAAAPVGYVFDSMYLYSNYNWSAVSSANVTVAKGDNTAQLKNKYNAIQYQYITINKTVNGLSQDKTYEFALKNSEGKYFNNDTKEFQTGIVYTSVSVTNGSGSIDIGKGTDKNYIPAGTYTLIEKDANESGYILETTGVGSFTVQANQNPTIYVSNKYTSNDSVFKLSVTKETENAPYNNTEYEFYVVCKKGTDTYYLKSDGNLTNNESDRSLFKIKNNETKELIIKDISSDIEITVVETSNSENNYYTLDKSYTYTIGGTTSTESATFTITNKEMTVTIKNSYTHIGTPAPTGEITLKKVDADATTTLLGGAVFSLTGTDGAATGATAASFTTVAGQAVVISGLKDGDYTLTETKAPDNYTGAASATTFTISSGAVSAVNGTATTDSVITITNTKNNTPAPTGHLQVHRRLRLRLLLQENRFLQYLLFR